MFDMTHGVGSPGFATTFWLSCCRNRPASECGGGFFLAFFCHHVGSLLYLSEVFLHYFQFMLLNTMLSRSVHLCGWSTLSNLKDLVSYVNLIGLNHVT